jgi:gliding motility-associated-like protein
MSKKYLLLFFVFLFTGRFASGQYFQLLYQPFELVQTTDTQATGVGSNSGLNKWTINNVYSGLSIYPNTVRQDSTYSGQITGAPFSKYLHIYDSGTGASQGILNCSYDPAATSDRFAVVDTDGVCTMGFDTVYLSFFYTCMGDTSNAYGQLYYSRNSGPWTLASQEHYSNKSKWKYELITNPAFLDASNLRFAFRWVNNNSAAPVTTAMGVDDVQIVGHYDSLSPPDTITVSVVDDTVCASTYVLFNINFSDTLCDGLYSIELSDFTGNFSTPTNLGIVGLNYPQTSFLFASTIASSTFPGNCYRIRITRILPPYPPIVIIVSGCFTVMQCPNTITTAILGQPVVTMDTNAVCAGSVIDVSFSSTGVYEQGNVYVLQLSDINGNFGPSPVALGSMLDNTTYNVFPYGSIGGLIPDTISPGCNYYIRVIGTWPAVLPSPTIGTLWGPFCIQHCDVITNNEQDIHMCVNPPQDTCIMIPVNMHFYDSTAIYGPNNLFSVQLISRGPAPPPMTEVGLPGALGSVIAINDTLLQLCLHLDSLAFWGIPAGSYYLRIVANNSSNSDNSLGSIIRFSFGYPASVAPSVSLFLWPSLVPTGTKVCLGDYILFQLNPPYNPNSTYNWQINSTVYPRPPNSFLVYVNAVQNFSVRVRENSVGCLGPLSPAISFTVIGPPNVNILGPPTICVGDTVRYRTIFQDSTFFLWGVTPSGTITDTSNNEAWFTFDSAGTYTLSVYALNRCFDTTNFRTITVKAPPQAYVGPDTAICQGSQVTLFNSPTDPAWTYRWMIGTSLQGTNDSITVSPPGTTTYILEVSSGVTTGPLLPKTHCKLNDTITVTVEQPTQTDFTDTVCVDGSPVILDPGINPATYLWYDSTTAQQHTVTDTGTYSVVIAVPGEACTRTYSYAVGPSYPDSSEQNKFICSGDPLILDASEPGAIKYLWSTGPNDTLSQISISSEGTYSVEITSSLRRCPFTKIYHAMEVPDSCDRNFTLPNVFTPNGDNFNETFHALTYGNYHTFLIKIFNRWGELVFESKDQYFKWDGTNLDGKDCTDGVYYYVGNIEHPEDTRALHGFVTLIRNNK